MEPPGPIPNPEVKRRSANGSETIGLVRVGRRQVYARLQAIGAGLFFGFLVPGNISVPKKPPPTNLALNVYPRRDVQTTPRSIPPPHLRRSPVTLIDGVDLRGATIKPWSERPG